MRLPRECYQMQKAIETHLPHLSQPQLTSLALWVCGAILAGSACQNAVASALSPWSNWHNLRQRLREWLYDGGDRATPCQTELDVTLCFAPLLRWVLAWWRSGGLALAIDPTLKGDQTTAIVISVLYRSCAIPVAWHIRHADQPGSWMDPIVELLQELAPAVPENMTVIVLCDRGIASPKLWNQIRAQSLPRRRPGAGIPVCATGRTSPSAPTAANGCPPSISYPVPIQPGSAAAPPSAPPSPSDVAPCWWSGTPSRRNPGSSSPTLRPIRWDPAGTPCASGSSWASRPSRAWAGNGTTRRTDPARVSRHWLALSVATLLALAYGTRVEDAQDRRIAPGSLRTPPKALAPNHRDPRSRPARAVSVIRHGIDWLRRLLLKGRLWSRVWLLPEPWPEPKLNLEITRHVPP